MTDMIRTTSGEYVHPLDHVQRRRWRSPGPPRAVDPTGADTQDAEVPARAI